MQTQDHPNASTIDVTCGCALEILAEIPDASIDLVLTDPPYCISKRSGMQQLADLKDATGGDSVKTEADWATFSRTLDKPPDELRNGCGRGWSKANYLAYGNIYGPKFCYRTDHAAWDRDFSLETLRQTVVMFHKKLRDGGTCIIWFDLWKLTTLRHMMEQAGFKQFRLVEWMKTNPVPINSARNYLSNGREVAISAVKGRNPTFNSSYDMGVYRYPSVRARAGHPTRKSLSLFEDLVAKHSRVGDLVVDTFLGSGTTAVACKRLGRRFRGCDISPEYVALAKKEIGAAEKVCPETRDAGNDDDQARRPHS